MSTKPTVTDDLHDRITDQALSELLGQQSPPDLTQQILTAAGDAKVDADRPMPVNSKSEAVTKSRWMLHLTAACLLVGLGTLAGLLIPDEQENALLDWVRVADSSTVADEDYDAPDHQNQILPSPYYISDDVLHFQVESEEGDELSQRHSGIQAEISQRDVKTYDLGDMLAPSETVTTPANDPALRIGNVPRPEELVDSKPSVSISGNTSSNGVRTFTGEVIAPDKPISFPRDPKNKTDHSYAVGGVGKAEAVKEHLYRANAGYVQQRGGKAPSAVNSPPRGFTTDLDLSFDQNSFGHEDTSRDRYGSIVENPFRPVLESPLSTFSIDVDTASYANVRRYLLQGHSLPPAGAVRIEELVNYFDYDYAPPRGDHPFASHVEVAGCPWQPGHRLVRVALKGKEIDLKERPESNLVFLLDVSGSMSDEDKLPLLKKGMQMLVQQLGENDRVAIVVYAGSEGLALPSTRGHHQQEILASLEKLQSGGSTNGGAGITLAYKIAQENYIEGGINRVLLCTDGDFNVGTTGTEALKKLVAERAKKGVFLSVLGFGRGNLNDEMMESISNRGNGNYSYIDNLSEARKVLVSQMSGTLVTIAKDVKIQIEFNPAQVQAYRLIGYENRILAAKDFNDDKKDAGEIGAGHTVTALYEIVPVGKTAKGKTDPLKYQPQPKRSAGNKNTDDKTSKELLTLKLRYKQPEGSKSKLLEVPVTDARGSFARSSKEFQFAAAVASFGMLLRGSKHRGGSSYSAVEEIASAASGKDPHGYRAEFLDMVRRAKSLGR